MNTKTVPSGGTTARTRQTSSRVQSRPPISLGLEDVAFDKLVADLIEHSNYFESRKLTGVAADCLMAAHELRNLRSKLRYLSSSEGGANDQR